MLPGSLIFAAQLQTSGKNVHLTLFLQENILKPKSTKLFLRKRIWGLFWFLHRTWFRSLLSVRVYCISWISKWKPSSFKIHLVKEVLTTPKSWPRTQYFRSLTCKIKITHLLQFLLNDVWSHYIYTKLMYLSIPNSLSISTNLEQLSFQWRNIISCKLSHILKTTAPEVRMRVLQKLTQERTALTCLMKKWGGIEMNFHSNQCNISTFPWKV